MFKNSHRFLFGLYRHYSKKSKCYLFDDQFVYKIFPRAWDCLEILFQGMWHRGSDVEEGEASWPQPWPTHEQFHGTLWNNSIPVYLELKRWEHLPIGLHSPLFKHGPTSGCYLREHRVSRHWLPCYDIRKDPRQEARSRWVTPRWSSSVQVHPTELA